MKSSKKDFLLYILAIACRAGMISIIISDPGIQLITRVVLILFIITPPLYKLEAVNRSRDILIERGQTSALVTIELVVSAVSVIIAKILFALITQLFARSFFGPFLFSEIQTDAKSGFEFFFAVDDEFFVANRKRTFEIFDDFLRDRQAESVAVTFAIAASRTV